MWQARGDGASRFCVLCKNIFTHESNVVLEDGTRLLRSNQIRLDDLEASSDTELRNNARYLERVSTALTHGQFTQLQQAMGLTYAPHGILLDRRFDRVLQSTSVCTHDYTHACFQRWCIELDHFLVVRGVHQVWQHSRV